MIKFILLILIPLATAFTLSQVKRSKSEYLIYKDNQDRVFVAWLIYAILFVTEVILYTWITNFVL